MLQVLRVLTLATVATASLYALLWLATEPWDTSVHASIIDTPRGEFDLYGRPVREFAYRLPTFCTVARNQRNLIFVGGSVARAYRPKVIEAAVPGWAVSDISLDLANITEIGQAFSLLRDCLGPDGLRGSIVVLAVNFLQFVPNSRLWHTPYTYLELDLLRHGLFDGPAGAMEPVVPWRWLPALITAMRPVLALYGASYRFNLHLEDFLHRRFGVRGLPDPQHRMEIQHMIEAFGVADKAVLQEQAAELDTLVANVKATGMRLVILDMPVEGWLRDSVPHFRFYRTWILDYVRQNGIPYIDHAFAGLDGDFRDGYHAKPETEPRWSELAADALSLISR